jgi:hypothetical protein
MVMSTQNTEAGTTPEERVPAMQRLLDNPFLLLFMGVATPAAFYLLWGVMELSQIPLAPQ